MRKIVVSGKNFKFFPKYFEIFLVISVSLFILALSFYPIYHRAKITPEDRIYVGTTYYTPDFAGYVSAIEQGIKWSLLHEDKFTTEDLPKTFLYFPYLILGQIAKTLKIDSISTYHLSRFVLGFSYLFLIYFLIKPVFPKKSTLGALKRIVAFLLAVFSSSFFVLEHGQIIFSPLSRMVAEVQVVNRFVTQPHFLLGNMAVVLGLILYLKYLSRPKLKYALFCGLIFYATAIFRPSHVAFALLAYSFFWLWQRKVKFDLFVVVSFLFSLPGFLYLFFLKQSYPYLPYFLYDLENKIRVGLWDWILLQGPVILVGIIGLVTAIKKGIRDEIKLIWSLIFSLAIFLFIAPHLFPLNPLRFLQVPLFVFLAILSTETLFAYIKKFYLVITIFILIIITGAPAVISDFRHEMSLYHDAYYIWPPKEYIPALKYLEKVSQPSDVVLTYISLSNLAPMISGNTVYWGHPNETLDYSKKEVLVNSFYKGEMAQEEALKFLGRNKIKYVLVGEEERSLGEIPSYSFLTKVYGNDFVQIYKLNQR